MGAHACRTRVYTSSMMAFVMQHLQTLGGQVAVALAFAGFWACFIDTIRRPIGRHVRGAAWWPRALPSQVSLLHNFGYPKDGTTEDMAVYGFVWIITMCITHIVSASLMLPVVLLGWGGAGDLGRLFFL